MHCQFSRHETGCVNHLPYIFIFVFVFLEERIHTIRNQQYGRSYANPSSISLHHDAT